MVNKPGSVRYGVHRREGQEGHVGRAIKPTQKVSGTGGLSMDVSPLLTLPGTGACGNFRHMEPLILPKAPGGDSVSTTVCASWRRPRHQEVTQVILGHPTGE